MRGGGSIPRETRIAHIITRLDRGGSAENTLLTVTLLDKGHYDVTLIYGETVEGLHAEIEQARRAGVHIIYLKELIRPIHPWTDFLAFIKLFSILRRGKYDIVHTHSSKGGALGRVAAFLAGIKLIVHTPHGHIFYGYFGPFANRALILIERLLGRVTDRLITLTHRGREEHVAFRILPPEKIVPIYSGIRLERFRDFDLLQEKGRSVPATLSKGSRIGLLARLAPIKGHRYFLEAVPKVLKQIPDAQFFLVGDGPLRADLERQCQKLGIHSSVTFLGDQTDVRSFLHEMNILVLPSLNEGMGRVLLEAQAAGKPVIGTRVGGIPEVIREGETGFVVPPKDPEALADAMIKLLKDPERQRTMGLAAKKWVDQKFSVEEMIQKISQLYEELIQKS